ncbi:MAG TPA: hypothetical protein VLR89_06860 [Anaerolineaceae bacterium]|nr:hypothetical protein [Anaerolineaceae bacterium]
MSKKFKDDFTLTTETDDQGHSRQVSTYIGSFFDLEIDQAGLSRLKVLAAFLYIGSLVSHVAAGFLPHSATNLWFVSLPYAVAYLPIGLLGFALLRLPRETQNLARYQTEGSFTRGRMFAAFALVLQIICTVGLAFFLLLTKGSLAAKPNYLFLLLEIFASVMCFGLLTQLNQIRISKRVDNNAN